MGRLTMLFVVCVVSGVGYAAGLWMVSVLHARYPALRPFIVTAGNSAWGGWFPAALTPLGILATIGAGLLIDLAVLGWDRSAVRRLASPDAAAKVDLLYLMLRLSGGMQLLAFVFSFGTMYYVAGRVHALLDIGVLSSTDSFTVQFVAVYLVNSLMFYAGHRLMHTRWLWEIHKVHHAAHDMNVITPLRNHPIDFAIMTVLYTFPGALLGVDPMVLLAYYAVNGLYQSLVHSELPVRGRFIEAIWITPAAHRIHHSSRPDHRNHNFGILTVWDKLFGTYHPPATGPLVYGVDGDILLNRETWIREIFAVVARSVAGARGRRQRARMTPDISGAES
jgi:sterol desaturase/sphingolipid hydroxylase (fatty acid hydroxylase superfamily)